MLAHTAMANAQVRISDAWLEGKVGHGAPVWGSVTIGPMTTPATPLKKSDQNLVWLDCKMTGLDPERERIIEIAVIVTSPDLACRVEGPAWPSTKRMRSWIRWTPGTRVPRQERPH